MATERGEDLLRQGKDEIEPSVYHISRPGLQKVLGELEAEIMALVWDNCTDEGMTVRDVYEVLQRRRHIAYTTVMTTMARLAKKKLLRTEKRDQAYIYYPNVSEAEFTSRFVGQILDQLLDNFSNVTIAHFAKLAEPGDKDALVKLLQDIISRHRGEETTPS